MTPTDQISLLKNLNEKLNGGRGVNMIRDAISYLMRGDLDQAKVCLLNDRDKLWQYDAETNCVGILEDAGLLPMRTRLEK